MIDEAVQHVRDNYTAPDLRTGQIIYNALELHLGPGGYIDTFLFMVADELLAEIITNTAIHLYPAKKFY
jgi:hypothetical protein